MTDSEVKKKVDPSLEAILAEKREERERKRESSSVTTARFRVLPCIAFQGWSPLLPRLPKIFFALRRPRPFFSSLVSRGTAALSRHPKRPRRWERMHAKEKGEDSVSWLTLERKTRSPYNTIGLDISAPLAKRGKNGGKKKNDRGSRRQLATHSRPFPPPFRSPWHACIPRLILVHRHHRRRTRISCSSRTWAH